ncbi:MAG: RuBisCO large subunit C-terminal-like domain-containing protein [Myxococcota bacterium]
MDASPDRPLVACYRLRVAAGQVEARAEALQLEQTVELPREALGDRPDERRALGRTETIEPDPEGGFRVRIAYPAEASAYEPAQLVNLLFGNSSLHRDVELIDVDLPPSLLARLDGPGVGLEGIRRACDARERPLSCAALKPLGLGPEALAERAALFARAGIDCVKDDHSLADQPFCPYEARVRACQAAIEAANRVTGHRTVYAPNVTGTPSRIRRQLELASALGIRAVLMSPMVVGLPSFFEAVRVGRDAPEPIAVLAHPALAGSGGIAPGVLLGTLFRALGADAVIYPHAGGRFAFSERQCLDLASRLRRPWSGLRPALPVPAGGMSVERAPELIRLYGRDVMLLIGGSLYSAGREIEDRSRAFASAVARAVAPEMPTGARA